MNIRSALYVGSVMHRRLRPRVHRLRYRVFWMLIDLDEIDRLARRLRLFAHNRFSVLSFHDADHGDGSTTALRPQIERHLEAAGIEHHGGAIKLLCMPRIFGFTFNPLSVYFCYAREGALVAIVYEVHNTFGQRHSYLIPVQNDAREVDVREAVTQQCRKAFYVSPFMDMDLSYQFWVTPPADHISVAINVSDRAGIQLVAALVGKARALSDAALLWLLATHPFVTLKVIGAIYWHAARMLLRGFRWRHRPAPPPMPVTTVRSDG